MKWTGIIAVTAVAALAACSKDSASTADTSVLMADTMAMAMPADTTPAAAAAPAGGLMDPNAATEADLAMIPGVTPQIATSIATGRPYANNLAMDKILAATSLTEQQRDSVYSRLWTPIDVNKATDDEIMLIPGVGSRMLREFKEYRPYTSIDQFRREIGKYVDAAELARLERFIVIR